MLQGKTDLRLTNSTREIKAPIANITKSLKDQNQILADAFRFCG